MESPWIDSVQGSRTLLASPWVLNMGLPPGPFVMRTMRCTICSEGLFGSLNTITSRTVRLSTGTRWLIATPPTANSGRILPQALGKPPVCDVVAPLGAVPAVARAGHHFKQAFNGRTTRADVDIEGARPPVA